MASSTKPAVGFPTRLVTFIVRNEGFIQGIRDVYRHGTRSYSLRIAEIVLRAKERYREYVDAKRIVILGWVEAAPQLYFNEARKKIYELNYAEGESPASISDGGNLCRFDYPDCTRDIIKWDLFEKWTRDDYVTAATAIHHCIDKYHKIKENYRRYRWHLRRARGIESSFRALNTGREASLRRYYAEQLSMGRDSVLS